MADPWTYVEALDHLSNVYQQHSELSSPRRRAITAVQTVYREWAYKHNWNYYNNTATFLTDEAQDTGTVTYVASTRVVTLAGGTFPTDAKLWKIKIEGVIYRIASYTDSTNIVLEPETAPEVNITTGVTFTIFHDTYLLEDNLRQILTIIDTDKDLEIGYMSSRNQEIRQNTYYEDSSDPLMYDFASHPDYPDRLLIRLLPSPSTARTYAYLYTKTPREIKVLNDYGTATYATTTTITTSLALAADRVGSIIWIAPNTSPPTGLSGLYNTNTNADEFNPYLYSRIITGISGTTVTVNETIASFTAGSGYLVSDYVDIQQGAMMTAFQRAIESEYCKLLNQSTDEITRRERDASKALIFAKESEHRHPYTHQSSSTYRANSLRNLGISQPQ